MLYVQLEVLLCRVGLVSEKEKNVLPGKIAGVAGEGQPQAPFLKNQLLPSLLHKWFECLDWFSMKKLAAFFFFSFSCLALYSILKPLCGGFFLKTDLLEVGRTILKTITVSQKNKTKILHECVLLVSISVFIKKKIRSINYLLTGMYVWACTCNKSIYIQNQWVKVWHFTYSCNLQQLFVQVRVPRMGWKLRLSSPNVSTWEWWPESEISARCCSAYTVPLVLGVGI